MSATKLREQTEFVVTGRVVEIRTPDLTGKHHVHIQMTVFDRGVMVWAQLPTSVAQLRKTKQRRSTPMVCLDGEAIDELIKILTDARRSVSGSGGYSI